MFVIEEKDQSNTCTIRLVTWTLQLVIRPNHVENLLLYILPCENPSIVLGLLWLRFHNPIIDWQSSQIISWSSNCTRECSHNTIHLGATSVESPNSKLPIEILVDYLSLKDGFTPVKSAHLPPHRPWDCAIDPLPGAYLGCIPFPWQKLRPWRSMWKRLSDRG